MVCCFAAQEGQPWRKKMKILSSFSEKKAMRTFSLFLVGLLLVLANSGMASRAVGTIIQVQRKIRMSDLEPLPPKEYFIDMGARDGIQTGERLQVFREVPVVNGQSGAPWHVLRVQIGEIQVAYVGETSSLAREVEGRDLASLPPLEYQTFMLGDEVQRIMGLQKESSSP